VQRAAQIGGATLDKIAGTSLDNTRGRKKPPGVMLMVRRVRRRRPACSLRDIEELHKLGFPRAHANRGLVVAEPAAMINA
jgi:hypothetical protein